MGFVREECSKLLRTRSRSRCFYHEYYKCFDIMPIAFADIEMIFDEESHALDWIFRYGNKALAELEMYRDTINKTIIKVVENVA